MSGNSFGRFFKITTWGESHGKAIGVVIDGVLPGVLIDISDIQKELDRRKPGQSIYVSSRKESDKVEILSGIYDGKTLGTPISLLIWNQDFCSKDYTQVKDRFRSGHADYTYYHKYSIYDYRGGGRSSGRETLARVAAGAIAKQILNRYEIKIYAYTYSIGNVKIKNRDYSYIYENVLRVPDINVLEKMQSKIIKIKKEKDSIGGILEIDIFNLPIGLGDPVFEKLDANLAKGLMSIGAVKGIEIGSGFKYGKKKGSESNDPWILKQDKVKTSSNHSGGILGGISNGMPVKIRIAVKAPSSIGKQKNFIDQKKQIHDFKMKKGRHDPCIIPRLVPIAESMVALVLCDHFLIQQIYNFASKKNDRNEFK